MGGVSLWLGLALPDGWRPARVARAFHRTLAHGVAAAIRVLAASERIDTVVLSGGVTQNQLLLGDIRDALADTGLELWTNRDVPPYDGGLSLNQAALAVSSGGGRQIQRRLAPNRQALAALSWPSHDACLS